MRDLTRFGDDRSDITYVVSNDTKSCSTLLIGNFPVRYGYACEGAENFKGDEDFEWSHDYYDKKFPSGTYEDFCDDLVEGANNFWTKQKDANSWSPNPVEFFSFITASVVDEQGLVRKYLQKFGFTEVGPRVYNRKNTTTCSFYLMPVPDFIPKLVEVGYKLINFRDQKPSVFNLKRPGLKPDGKKVVVDD